MSPTGSPRFDEPEAAGQLGGEVDADRARRPAASPRSRPGSSPTCSRRARHRARSIRGRSGNARARRRRRRSRRAAARRRGRDPALRAARAPRATGRAGSPSNGACSSTAVMTRPPQHGTDHSVGRSRSSATRAGHDGRRQRPVGDVFARERVLVHLGAHVAGIDDQHAQLGLLGREHRRQVFERGLRRAVAAPLS